MQRNPPPFLPGLYYHVYNRGNNGETVFRQERNYRYFLELYALHIYQIAETFAYCLLPNHFHFLIRIRDAINLPRKFQSISETVVPDSNRHPRSIHVMLGQQFATMCGSYAKAVNNAFHRTGSMFEKPIHRKIVTSEAYFTNLVAYIHRNPQNHGLIDDYRIWPYSSYSILLSEKPSRLERSTLLNWFDGVEGLKEIHEREVDEKGIEAFLFDE